MYCFIDKIAGARVFPLQHISPLLDISGSLQRVFHRCPQASPWTALPPCFFAAPIISFPQGTSLFRLSWGP